MFTFTIWQTMYLWEDISQLWFPDICMNGIVEEHHGNIGLMMFPFPFLIWIRADSRLAPNQWETSLLSNDVSHWLGANLESAIWMPSPAIWPVSERRGSPADGCCRTPVLSADCRSCPAQTPSTTARLWHRPEPRPSWTWRLKWGDKSMD